MSWLADHAPLATEAGVRALLDAAYAVAPRSPRQALAVAEVAAVAASGLGERSRLDAMRAQARACYGAARYREAASLLTQVAAAHERRGEAAEAGAAHLGRCASLLYIGRAAECVAIAERARDLYETAGDRLGMAKADVNMGLVYHRLDQLRAALAHFRRARPYLVRAGDECGAAVIDLDRALTHSLLGHPRRADRLFAAARAAFTRHGQAVRVALVDYNRACDRLTTGLYDQAWHELEACGAAFTNLGDPFSAALVDLDLAELALAIGAEDVAGARAAAAVTALEDLGIPLESGRARCLAATVLARKGEVERAIAVLDLAVHELESSGHDVRAALARLELASLLVPTAPDRAASLAGSAGSVLRGAGFRNASARARLLENLAVAELDPEAARPSLERLARHRSVPDVRWRADAELGRLALTAGRGRAAERHLARATRAVDALRADLRRGDLAAGVLGDRGELYELAMRAALASQPPGRAAARALEYAERGRSRALADRVAAGAATCLRPTIAGSPREVARLGRSLDRSYRKLLDSRRSAPPDELMAAIDRDERALATLLGAVDLHVSGQPSPAPDAAAYCRALTPRQLLVAYQRLGDELWALVADRHGVQATRLAARAGPLDELRAELEYQVAKFNLGDDYVRAQARGLRRSMDRCLERLGRILVAPMPIPWRGREVIVVPAGELHQVPYAALRVGDRYVVEEGEVAVAPSATVFALLQGRRRRARGGPLVVGLGDRATPNVAPEARAVAALLPGAVQLQAREATRAAFARAARGRSVIHIATHGLFRPERPTLSSLRLADGWLTLHEMYALRLSADLVTVAACHSGRSRVGVGNELEGLASGLLHAGASTVLVGLWSLDDRSARRVMTSFYDGYRRRVGKAAALRQAMLAEMGRSPHPYYWAPYTLVGAP